ncbi:uncharacterized protein [Venturia canescens]|uniref:uncharacterized protein n=1 Tax=Venturia canescens TaxID=32260 RepID=UPI001C9BDF19|nr:uncharacterized protein LOC122415906 [Venturia canescens]
MRNRSSDESDDSENADPAEKKLWCRSRKVDSLNWNINRELFVAHVATEQKTTSPHPASGQKSDAVKSVKSKASKEPKPRSKLRDRATLLCGKSKTPKDPNSSKPQPKLKGKTTSICRGRQTNSQKASFWCCCKQSDKSADSAPSKSKKNKKRKKIKKTNEIAVGENESRGIQVQEEKFIEKKHDELREGENERVQKLRDDEKTLKFHDHKEIHSERTQETSPPQHIGIPDQTRFERPNKEIVREKPDPNVEISPLVTAGTSVDRTKTCCYLCAQNATVIREALETLITPKRIERRTDTKSTQVAEKYRVKTKPEPIETFERSTAYTRSDLPNERKKSRIKKCKISKYIRNVFTGESVGARDATPSIRTRQTVCCRNNCRFAN